LINFVFSYVTIRLSERANTTQTLINYLRKCLHSLFPNELKNDTQIHLVSIHGKPRPTTVAVFQLATADACNLASPRLQLIILARAPTAWSHLRSIMLHWWENIGCDWMGGYPLSQTSTMQSMDVWKPALPSKPGKPSAKSPLLPALWGTLNLGVSSLCMLQKLS